MMRRIETHVVGLVCLCVVVLNGCERSRSNRADQEASVEILLNWFPDCQHGGFYAAAETADAAIEGGARLRIVPGGPGSPVIQNVALGQSDYGIANADQILLARAQGAKIVALLAVMQSSPRCIMVHEQSGIKSLDQLANVKLAVGAGKAFAKFLQQHLPLEGVTLVNYTGSVAPFLADPNLAQQAYIFSEPRLVAGNGIKATTLMVSELGFNPYNTCLIAREALVKEHPGHVAQVVRTVRQGWLQYLDAPAATHQRILLDNPQMDMESLQFGAEAIKPLCLPAGMDRSEFGQMQSARWEQLARQLEELELLDQPIDVSSAYTNEFLQGN